MNKNMMNHFAMIIFGASGDLTKRKLIPALYTLYKEQRLTGNFSILGVSRTKYDDQSFQTYMWEEMQHFIKKRTARRAFDAGVCDTFALSSHGPCKG